MQQRKHFDVFLSHNSVDKPWALRLKAALQTKGLKVWIDHDEIRPGDLFVGALEAGLEESKSVVLIVSPEAMKSGWVKEEYSRALSLAQEKRQPLQLIPLILREAILPGFLANRNWVDFRDTATFETNLQQLIWGVTGLKLDGSSPGESHNLDSSDPCGAITERTLHNLPQPEYGTFIGREKEITQINQILRPYPHSQHALVTIDGVGGIGKTALALEVAHRYLHRMTINVAKECFAAIIWISAKHLILTADGLRPRKHALRNVQDLYSTIVAILCQDDDTSDHREEERERVRRLLAQHRTLVIVDNLETVDDEEVVEFLRDLPAPTKAIVTTRHRIDVAYPVRLVGMGFGDAQLLIEQECKKKLVSLTPDDTHRLYDRTGGVPLAIVWSVAQMGWGHTIDGVLDRLGQPTGDIARFCFDRAVESISGKSSHTLLMALSYFESTSREALGYLTALSDFDRDDGLVELEKLSLVNHEGAIFTMLPLTRAFVRTQLDKDIKARRRLDHKYQQWVQKIPLKESTRTFHKVIGIDFGTTYSRVAVWDNAKSDIVIIPSLTGLSVLPSVIGLDPEGKVAVGESAEANLVRDPNNTVLDIKRSVGVYEMDDHPRRIYFRGREYLPQELVAFILSALKRQAEVYIGEPIRDAVITVPAYFTESQKRAMMEAAQIAKLDVRRLLSDPTAAALSFGADKIRTEGRHVYAVYDLGGGTFDISIIAVQESHVEVIAIGGDSRLGGRDFDERLANYILDVIAKKHGVDLSQTLAARMRIVREAEMAKKQLSATGAVLVDIPFLSSDLSVTIEITRSLFESLVFDLVRRTLTCLDSVIKKASEMEGTRRNDIEQVLLVGGATRIPLIRKMIASHLDLSESDLRSDLNPDEVVVRGACILSRDYVPRAAVEDHETRASANGGDIDRSVFTPPAVLVQEISSRTLGVLVGDGGFQPIILKNSRIPVRATLAGLTNAGRTRELKILVFEGEDRIAFNNSFVGKVSISLPEECDAGFYRYGVTFSIDESGLLEVTVASEIDEQVWHCVLQSGSRLTPEEIGRERLHVQETLASLPVFEGVSGHKRTGPTS